MAEDNTATNPTNSDDDGAQVDNRTDQEPVRNDADKPEMSIDDYKAALAEARSEAAKYRVERNELRGDAQAYRDLKESEKTELQKVQEALEEARTDAAKSKTELQRVQLMNTYGLSEENADLLGDDPEKFEANAQRIKSIQEEAAKKAAPPSETPVENLRAGAGVDAPAAADFGFPSSWPVSGPFANNS